MHNMLYKSGGYMDMNTMDPRYLMYGALSVLDNRIAALQSEDFTDLTMKQHFLLVSIGMFEESPTLGQVSELIGCSYQNVRRMAEQLQAKGYLVICKDEVDKRKLRLVATQQFMDRMYQGISETDLMQALKVIQKMTENINE